MPDKTSDDYLNQPEPGVEDEDRSPDVPEIQDDPVIAPEAAAAVADFFAKRAVAEEVPREPRASMQAAPTLTEFMAAEASDTSALQVELEETKRQLVLLQMAPQERYPEVLKDAKVDLEHARRILDKVIIGLTPWVEKVDIKPGFSVTLQTRAQQDMRRLNKWAEATRPQLDTTVQTEALMNNMAASLVAYGDKKFLDEDGDEESRYKAAYAFIESMPYPAFRLVQRALAKFDDKINVVFSEGYLENF